MFTKSRPSEVTAEDEQVNANVLVENEIEQTKKAGSGKSYAPNAIQSNQCHKCIETVNHFLCKILSFGFYLTFAMQRMIDPH